MLLPVFGAARMDEGAVGLHQELLSTAAEMTATSVGSFDPCKCIYRAHNRFLPLFGNIFPPDIYGLVCFAFRPVEVIINGRIPLAHQQISMR